MDDKEHVYEDGRPIIPTLVKLLVLLLCPVVWGCATVQPKMPPAIKYNYSGEHGNAVFYADEPCSPIVLQLIPPDIRTLFKGGEGTYDGPKYALCWTPEPDNPDVIFLLWEDGGMGRLSKEILQPGLGV